MSAPLAGRPPFATDEPDTIYETSPTPARRRVAPEKQDNPNKRTSAYDVYDNYLEGEPSSTNPFSSPPRKKPGDDKANNASHLRPPRPQSGTSQKSRNSGVGGIGMGLLNMDFSDSEDDSDDDGAPAPRVDPAAKNAALAAAVNQKSPAPPQERSPFSPPPSSSSPLHNSPTKSNNANNAPAPLAAPPIAAPRPGYAAPISALQNPFEPSNSPPSPGGPHRGPNQTQAQQFHGPPPQMNHMPPNPNGGGYNPINRMPSSRLPPPGPIGGVPPPISIPQNVMTRGGPMHSMSPAPLQAPATPIIPVFAIPRTEKDSTIKFGDLPAPTPRKPIMRGNAEETLLPRRGEKGDDFWRRFSMIAKDEGGKKESPWLRKTRSGSSRLSAWVWVIGVAILLAIIGSIVLGVLLSRGKTDEESSGPTVLGGATSKAVATFGSSTKAAAIGSAAGTSRTVLHVTPTHTLAERGIFEVAVASAAPGRGLHSRRNARKMA